MTCVATWSFGLPAVVAAAKIMEQGGSCLDAVEKGINIVEDDPSTGPYHVGRGCYPNSEGVVQLDAAIMTSKDFRIGAVAGLEGYAKPISVARKVLEEPNVNMLVGSAAADFAKKHGFTMEDNDALLTERSRKAYQEFKATGAMPAIVGHDTLALLSTDNQGSVVVGVSTSGPAFKPPGRVGDVPLVGCGFYAENKVGAAAATGDGEKIMQFCPSFQTVAYIRQGMAPMEAVEYVFRLIREKNGGKLDFDISLIALGAKGDIGVGTTVEQWTDLNGEVYEGFPCAYWRKDRDEPQIKVTEQMFGPDE